jgi:hypothetical protein
VKGSDTDGLGCGSLEADTTGAHSCTTESELQASNASRQYYLENTPVTLHPANYFGFRETTLHAELLEHPVAETNRQRSSRLAFAFKFTPKREANLSKGSCA